VSRATSPEAHPDDDPAAPPRSAEPAELFDAARRGERGALARLLSMVERGGESARAVARIAYRDPPPYTVGLTGAPGAGKSTLCDRLITAARGGWPGEGGVEAEPVDQVAVLAVDPTSPFSGGAILGDRIRMQDHATDASVFIRSMATRGHLGGLALAVPGALRVLGAARVPVALVETVGVGQMEVEVASACDTTVVVVTPGWGDSLQANKAGLLEVADLLVINKADRPGTEEARRDLRQMLELSAPGPWRPPIVETVATDGRGLPLLWAEIGRHRAFLTEGGLLGRRRSVRLEEELRRVLGARLEARIGALADQGAFAEVLRAVVAGTIDPYEAADRLLAEADAG
jgi:LAO/AO transport system kinase